MNDSIPSTDRTTPTQKTAGRPEWLNTQICYRGFAYNVRSQEGIDSLRRAIERNGHG